MNAQATIDGVAANRTRTLRQIAIAVGGEFALDGPEKAFNECERHSALMHQELRRRGIDARRANGEFRPTAHPDSWHRGWSRPRVPLSQFRHYWVVVDDMILDPTAAQFGEENLLVASVGDPRYADDGFADGRSPDAPLGIKKHPHAVCHLHRLDDIATEPTHAVRKNGQKLRVCQVCAERLAGEGWTSAALPAKRQQS